MPKCLSLFGKYIRQQGNHRQNTFRKYQITRVVPNNSSGRVPSAASQMALFHNDDYNAYWRLSAFNTMFRKKLRPYRVFRDLDSSKQLGSQISDVRVTPSALYAMDDKGGFDNYILRTPPQDLRSSTGEKMRNLMYFYLENPQVRKWGLSWKNLARKRDLADPSYARYRIALRRTDNSSRNDTLQQRYSPYFLPRTNDQLFPQRDVPVASDQSHLTLWWKRDCVLEEGLRNRLGQAKSFEEAHPDDREVGSYRKGDGAGGGGGQGSPRPRSKTHRSRQSRAY